MGPDLQQLKALVPNIPSPTIQSVYEHYEKNGSQALDALLGMGSPAGWPTPPYTEHQAALEKHPPTGSPPHKHHFCSSDKKEPYRPHLGTPSSSHAPIPTPVDLAQDKALHRKWWPGAPGWPIPGQIAHTQDPPEVADRGGGHPATLASNDDYSSGNPYACEYPAARGSAAGQSGPSTPRNSDDSQGLGSMTWSGEGPLALEEALVDALPHLVPCRHTPTTSGSASPVLRGSAAPPRPIKISPLNPASASSPPGFTPVELVEMATFYQDMFPALEREVVSDVLQRYSDTPQTALEQLCMLSTCVEDAATGSAHGFQLPDHCSWDDGGSWDGSSTESPGSPASLDALLSEGEAVEALRADFSGVAEDEARGALDACGGSLAAAAALLRAYQEEGPAEEEKTAGDAIRAAQQHPAVAALALRFPCVPEESLEVALQCSDYECNEAAAVLVAQGYTEAAAEEEEEEEEETPALVPAPKRAPAPAPVAVAPAPKRRVVPLDLAKPAPRAVALPAPGMSISELSHRHNSTIYEDSHGTAKLLHNAYTKCFVLASEAFHRGDHAAASRLAATGREYRDRYEAARRRGTNLMSKKINEGNSGEAKVDMHGMYVDEALDLVQRNIDTMPTNFPGGMRMRYITGKGLHSAGGPRLKPAVIDLLASRGIPYVEEPGYVVATFQPA